MKFFHLSDLHIGIKLFNRDLYQDQKYILEQIIRYAKQELPDVIIIAGDIYDKPIPAADAVELFDWFVTELIQEIPAITIMMISGNHDSAQRIDCYRNILSKQQVYMVGLPPRKETDGIQQVTIEDSHGEVNFYLLPFVKPSMVRNVVNQEEEALSYDRALHLLLERQKVNWKKRNVLVSHQFYLPKGKNPKEVERSDSEILMVGNVDVVWSDCIDKFDYCALGHIHKPMTVQRDYIRYCGTPMPYSISEAGQKKQILMVELKEKESTPMITPLNLTPLHKVLSIKGELDDVLDKACEDYVSVCITNREDLDTIDMQEKLRLAFPNLLEIRRESFYKTEENLDLVSEKQLEPLELCRMFLQNVDEESFDILQDVINTVKEELS